MSNNIIVARRKLQGALAQFLSGDDYYLKLFTNSALTPDLDMEPADFTEAAGGGYAHQVVDSSVDFTTEYANNPPDIIMDEVTFSFTGPLTGNATVYGYYFQTQNGNYVDSAKLLDTPFTPASGGGTLKFTPRIQAGNGTPA
ncbi:MAG: hypothetical protein A4E66_00171 [Syntrophus sp. PtaB.Bin001]|nr:MAG: hypothetical protein A4E66_00171 [Syntrophus sp. PtaB.Bin001]